MCFHGSHPSLSGSYLAACVFHSTLTGETCVGSNDTISLNASVKLALQEAADDTVFNQTAGMSYYPWEVSGMAAFGLGSSIPPGWNIQWQEDELSNIPAGDILIEVGGATEHLLETGKIANVACSNVFTCPSCRGYVAPVRRKIRNRVSVV